MNLMDAFLLGQAAVALLTTALLVAIGVRVHTHKVTISWPHLAVLTALVAGVAIGNVVTPIATIIGAGDARNTAGLFIRILLLTIAAYGATLVWKDKD